MITDHLLQFLGSFVRSTSVSKYLTCKLRDRFLGSRIRSLIPRQDLTTPITLNGFIICPHGLEQRVQRHPGRPHAGHKLLGLRVQRDLEIPAPLEPEIRFNFSGACYPSVGRALKLALVLGLIMGTINQI